MKIFVTAFVLVPVTVRATCLNRRGTDQCATLMDAFSQTQQYQTMTEASCFNFCGREFRNNNAFYFGTLDCVTGCRSTDLTVASTSASASVLPGSRLTGDPIYVPISHTDPDSVTSTGYTVVGSPDTFVTTTHTPPETAAASLDVAPIPFVQGVPPPIASTTPSGPATTGARTTTPVKSKGKSQSLKGSTTTTSSSAAGVAATTLVGGATTTTPVKSKGKSQSLKGSTTTTSSSAAGVAATTLVGGATTTTPVKSKRKSKSLKGSAITSTSSGGVAATTLVGGATTTTPVKSKGKSKSLKGSAITSTSSDGVAAATLVGGATTTTPVQSKGKSKSNRSPPRTAPPSLVETVGTGNFEYTLITDTTAGTTIGTTTQLNPPTTVAATTTTGGSDTVRWWYTQDANGVGHLVSAATGSVVSQVLNPAPAPPVIAGASIDAVTVAGSTGTVGATVIGGGGKAISTAQTTTTYPALGHTASGSVISCSKGKGHGCGGRSRQSRAYSYEALISSATSPTAVATGAAALVLWNIL